MMTLPAAASDAVVARALTRRFGEFTAVDALDLRIARGEVLGFIGPNGAGKSTTIRMFCGLLTPTSGAAEVAGFDVRGQSQQLREHIGYMSQKFSLYGDLTVIENLQFFAGIYRVPRHELARRIDYAIAMSGLEGRADALVASLAGGWKQRLALGCAILHRPPVLFLDEPTSGVEPAARRLFWDLIHTLAGDGVTILVSTHYMEEAEYCNRIAIIDHGRLVATGSPGELRARGLDGDLVEIACSPLGAALDLLLVLPGVIDAAIFGDRVHVLLGPGAPQPGAIGALLRQAGLKAGEARRVRPSLEDVFVRQVALGQGRPGL
ncbi:putative ABC transporter ATP-binding protein YbhF [mine drainage metagenome]|jgi:ABC-2 type transport system ATP-binding protein|uniref:Putative ABC transporter ATP-binding protein YbhF n=1 Tax=mine drainage metagenome TaxID=410659 RepID=A0A1J5Q2I7_9ZZZZ